MNMSAGRQRVAVTQRALVGMLVAIFFSIGLAAAAGGLALKLLSDAQSNRVFVNQQICLRVNDIALGQRAFIHKVQPGLDADARAFFRVVEDCRAYARRIVKPKPPQP